MTKKVSRVAMLTAAVAMGMQNLVMPMAVTAEGAIEIKEANSVNGETANFLLKRVYFTENAISGVINKHGTGGEGKKSRLFMMTDSGIRTDVIEEALRSGITVFNGSELIELGELDYAMMPEFHNLGFMYPEEINIDHTGKVFYDLYTDGEEKTIYKFDLSKCNAYRFFQKYKDQVEQEGYYSYGCQAEEDGNGGIYYRPFLNEKFEEDFEPTDEDIIKEGIRQTTEALERLEGRVSELENALATDGGEELEEIGVLIENISMQMGEIERLRAEVVEMTNAATESLANGAVDNEETRAMTEANLAAMEAMLATMTGMKDALSEQMTNVMSVAEGAGEIAAQTEATTRDVKATLREEASMAINEMKLAVANAKNMVEEAKTVLGAANSSANRSRPVDGGESVVKEVVQAQSNDNVSTKSEGEELKMEIEALKARISELEGEEIEVPKLNGEKDESWVVWGMAATVALSMGLSALVAWAVCRKMLIKNK